MKHYLVLTVADEVYLVIAQDKEAAANDYTYPSEVMGVYLATPEEIETLNEYPYNIFYDETLLND